jgi:hypothetical protein
LTNEKTDGEKLKVLDKSCLGAWCGAVRGAATRAGMLPILPQEHGKINANVKKLEGDNTTHDPRGL